MQIDGEDIESLRANMMLEKNFKKPQIQQNNFAYILLDNGLNNFTLKFDRAKYYWIETSFDELLSLELVSL